MFQSSYIEKEKADRLIRVNEKKDINSMFGFLNSHNGFRKGKTHILLGSSGGGKTSVVRSIIKDFLIQNKGEMTCGIYLSEENVEEFQTEFSRIDINRNLLKSLEIFSEIDKPLSEEGLKDKIENYFSINKPDFFIFDNITTSALYLDRKSTIQADFVRWLKIIAKKFEVALLLVAHTGADIVDNCNRMIQMNDIRGSKNIVNFAEFFYILQMFGVKDKKIQTLRIVKHRGQDCITNMYTMQWNNKSREYDRDFQIEFDSFRELWSKRNVL